MSAPMYLASGGRGVYAILCVDGRAYVGSSADLRVRKNQHKSTLRKGKHGNPPLQEAWNDLGEDAFEFCVLEQVPEGDLLAAEQKWIDSLDPASRFNRAPNAGSTAGLVHTEKSRAKFSAAKVGKSLSLEHRANMSASHRGKALAPDHCEKLSAAKTGEANAAAKIRECDVLTIRGLARAGQPQRSIAERFGITSTAVSAIVRRRNWSHVKDVQEASA